MRWYIYIFIYLIVFLSSCSESEGITPTETTLTDAQMGDSWITRQSTVASDVITTQGDASVGNLYSIAVSRKQLRVTDNVSIGTQLSVTQGFVQESFKYSLFKDFTLSQVQPSSLSTRLTNYYGSRHDPTRFYSALITDNFANVIPSAINTYLQILRLKLASRGDDATMTYAELQTVINQGNALISLNNILTSVLPDSTNILKILTDPSQIFQNVIISNQAIYTRELSVARLKSLNNLTMANVQNIINLSNALAAIEAIISPAVTSTTYRVDANALYLALRKPSLNISNLNKNSASQYVGKVNLYRRTNAKALLWTDLQLAVDTINMELLTGVQILNINLALTTFTTTDNLMTTGLSLAGSGISNVIADNAVYYTKALLRALWMKAVNILTITEVQAIVNKVNAEIELVGLLTGVNKIIITNAGTGYTALPSVSIVLGGGTGAFAQAVVTNGIVSAINIVQRGTSYNFAPTVNFVGGLGINGSPASAIAVVADSAMILALLLDARLNLLRIDISRIAGYVRRLVSKREQYVKQDSFDFQAAIDQENYEYNIPGIIQINGLCPGTDSTALVNAMLSISQLTGVSQDYKIFYTNLCQAAMKAKNDSLSLLEWQDIVNTSVLLPEIVEINNQVNTGVPSSLMTALTASNAGLLNVSTKNQNYYYDVLKSYRALNMVVQDKVSIQNQINEANMLSAVDYAITTSSKDEVYAGLTLNNYNGFNPAPNYNFADAYRLLLVARKASYSGRFLKQAEIQEVLWSVEGGTPLTITNAALENGDPVAFIAGISAMGIANASVRILPYWFYCHRLYWQQRRGFSKLGYINAISTVDAIASVESGILGAADSQTILTLLQNRALQITGLDTSQSLAYTARLTSTRYTQNYFFEQRVLQSIITPIDISVSLINNAIDLGNYDVLSNALDSPTITLTSVSEGVITWYYRNLVTAKTQVKRYLNISEIQNQINIVNNVQALDLLVLREVSVLSSIAPSGLGAALTSAGIQNVNTANLQLYYDALRALTSASDVYLNQTIIQNTINSTNALNLINTSASSITAQSMYDALLAIGVTGGPPDNTLQISYASNYKEAIVSALATTTSVLTPIAIQSIVDNVALLITINLSLILANPVPAQLLIQLSNPKSLLTQISSFNQVSYTSALSLARRSTGRDLSRAEMQAVIDNVNGGSTISNLSTALTTSVEAFWTPFLSATTNGVFYNVNINYKDAYYSNFTLKFTRNGNIALAKLDYQRGINEVNAINNLNTILTSSSVTADGVFTALIASGMNVFNVAVWKQNNYLKNLVAARTTKGSALTLSEIQSQVNLSNSTNANMVVQGKGVDDGSAGLSVTSSGNLGRSFVKIITSANPMNAALTFQSGSSTPYTATFACKTANNVNQLNMASTNGFLLKQSSIGDPITFNVTANGGGLGVVATDTAVFTLQTTSSAPETQSVIEFGNVATQSYTDVQIPRILFSASGVANNVDAGTAGYSQTSYPKLNGTLITNRLSDIKYRTNGSFYVGPVAANTPGGGYYNNSSTLYKNNPSLTLTSGVLTIKGSFLGTGSYQVATDYGKKALTLQSADSNVDVVLTGAATSSNPIAATISIASNASALASLSYDTSSGNALVMSSSQDMVHKLSGSSTSTYWQLSTTAGYYNNGYSNVKNLLTIGPTSGYGASTSTVTFGTTFTSLTTTVTNKMSSSLAVTGPTVLSSTLNVASDATIGGKMNLAGSFNGSDSMTIAKNVTLMQSPAVSIVLQTTDSDASVKIIAANSNNSTTIGGYTSTSTSSTSSSAATLQLQSTYAGGYGFYTIGGYYSQDPVGSFAMSQSELRVSAPTSIKTVTTGGGVTWSTLKTDGTNFNATLSSPDGNLSLPGSLSNTLLLNIATTATIGSDVTIQKKLNATKSSATSTFVDAVTLNSDLVVNQGMTVGGGLLNSNKTGTDLDSSVMSAGNDASIKITTGCKTCNNTLIFGSGASTTFLTLLPTASGYQNGYNNGTLQFKSSANIIAEVRGNTGVTVNANQVKIVDSGTTGSGTWTVAGANSGTFNGFTRGGYYNGYSSFTTALSLQALSVTGAATIAKQVSIMAGSFRPLGGFKVNACASSCTTATGLTLASSDNNATLMVSANTGTDTWTPRGLGTGTGGTANSDTNKTSRFTFDNSSATASFVVADKVSGGYYGGYYSSSTTTNGYGNFISTSAPVQTLIAPSDINIVVTNSSKWNIYNSTPSTPTKQVEVDTAVNSLFVNNSLTTGKSGTIASKDENVTVDLTTTAATANAKNITLTLTNNGLSSTIQVSSTGEMFIKGSNGLQISRYHVLLVTSVAATMNLAFQNYVYISNDADVTLTLPSCNSTYIGHYYIIITDKNKVVNLNVTTSTDTIDGTSGNKSGYIAAGATLRTQRIACMTSGAWYTLEKSASGGALTSPLDTPATGSFVTFKNISTLSANQVAIDTNNNTVIPGTLTMNGSNDATIGTIAGARMLTISSSDNTATLASVATKNDGTTTASFDFNSPAAAKIGFINSPSTQEIANRINFVNTVTNGKVWLSVSTTPTVSIQSVGTSASPVGSELLFSDTSMQFSLSSTNASPPIFTAQVINSATNVPANLTVAAVGSAESSITFGNSTTKGSLSIITATTTDLFLTNSNATGQVSMYQGPSSAASNIRYNVDTSGNSTLSYKTGGLVVTSDTSGSSPSAILGIRGVSSSGVNGAQATMTASGADGKLTIESSTNTIFTPIATTTDMVLTIRAISSTGFNTNTITSSQATTANTVTFTTDKLILSTATASSNSQSKLTFKSIDGDGNALSTIFKSDGTGVGITTKSMTLYPSTGNGTSCSVTLRGTSSSSAAYNTVLTSRVTDLALDVNATVVAIKGFTASSSASFELKAKDASSTAKAYTALLSTAGALSLNTPSAQTLIASTLTVTTPTASSNAVLILTPTGAASSATFTTDKTALNQLTLNVGSLILTPSVSSAKGNIKLQATSSNFVNFEVLADGSVFSMTPQSASATIVTKATSTVYSTAAANTSGALTLRALDSSSAAFDTTFQNDVATNALSISALGTVISVNQASTDVSLQLNAVNSGSTSALQNILSVQNSSGNLFATVTTTGGTSSIIFATNSSSTADASLTLRALNSGNAVDAIFTANNSTKEINLSTVTGLTLSATGSTDTCTVTFISLDSSNAQLTVLPTITQQVDLSSTVSISPGGSTGSSIILTPVTTTSTNATFVLSSLTAGSAKKETTFTVTNGASSGPLTISNVTTIVSAAGNGKNSIFGINATGSGTNTVAGPVFTVDNSSGTLTVAVAATTPKITVNSSSAGFIYNTVASTDANAVFTLSAKKSGAAKNVVFTSGNASNDLLISMASSVTMSSNQATADMVLSMSANNKVSTITAKSTGALELLSTGVIKSTANAGTSLTANGSDASCVLTQTAIKSVSSATSVSATMSVTSDGLFLMSSGTGGSGVTASTTARLASTSTTTLKIRGKNSSSVDGTIVLTGSSSTMAITSAKASTALNINSDGAVFSSITTSAADLALTLNAAGASATVTTTLAVANATNTLSITGSILVLAASAAGDYSLTLRAKSSGTANDTKITAAQAGNTITISNSPGSVFLSQPTANNTCGITLNAMTSTEGTYVSPAATITNQIEGSVIYLNSTHLIQVPTTPDAGISLTVRAMASAAVDSIWAHTNATDLSLKTSGSSGAVYIKGIDSNSTTKLHFKASTASSTADAIFLANNTDGSLTITPNASNLFQGTDVTLATNSGVSPSVPLKLVAKSSSADIPISFTVTAAASVSIATSKVIIQSSVDGAQAITLTAGTGGSVKSAVLLGSNSVADLSFKHLDASKGVFFAVSTGGTDFNFTLRGTGSQNSDTVFKVTGGSGTSAGALTITDGVSNTLITPTVLLSPSGSVSPAISFFGSQLATLQSKFDTAAVTLTAERLTVTATNNTISIASEAKISTLAVGSASFEITPAAGNTGIVNLNVGANGVSVVQQSTTSASSLILTATTSSNAAVDGKLIATATGTLTITPASAKSIYVIAGSSSQDSQVTIASKSDLSKNNVISLKASSGLLTFNTIGGFSLTPNIDAVQLLIQGSSSQSKNIFEVTSNDGAKILFGVSPTGNVVGQSGIGERVHVHKFTGNNSNDKANLFSIRNPDKINDWVVTRIMIDTIADAQTQSAGIYCDIAPSSSVNLAVDTKDNTDQKGIINGMVFGKTVIPMKTPLGKDSDMIDAFHWKNGDATVTSTGNYFFNCAATEQTNGLTAYMYFYYTVPSS